MSERLVTILLLFSLFLAARPKECDSGLERSMQQCQRDAVEAGSRAVLERLTARGSDENKPKFSGPADRQNTEKAADQENRQRELELIAEALETSRTIPETLYLNERLIAIEKACQDAKEKYLCDPLYPYRAYNGTCNNLAHPDWGSWNACEERLFEPSYRGVAGFRRSVTGRPLPGARVVSLKFSHGQKITRGVSHLFPLFGQFVAHDITDTIVSSDPKTVITCCDVPEGSRHPQCAPIKLPKRDPFYSRFNQTCMDFVRSAPCDTCTLGKRRQINQVTSFLDCSTVYGSTTETNAMLREFRRGRLKTQEVEGSGSLLPPKDGNGVCSFQKQERCFMSGDRRVNQHLSLMSLQTLFLREHNRVAGIIELKHPYFDDETIFQEARKIVIAELQSIIYNEFLPILVGEEIMQKYDLGVSYDGTSRYDPLLNPTILSEFNTAGYRLHSMVHLYASSFPIEGKILRFKNTFQNAEPLYHGGLEDVLQGVSRTPAQRYDRWVVTDMTEYLYKGLEQVKGLDIVSANVQRGRDHGLPPYYRVLEYRTGKKIKDFEDLEEFIEPDPLAKLKEIYKDVRDIDLWIGLLGEIHNSDQILGPTARLLVGEQFWRLRYGDRFFYTEPGHFTKDQLKALNTASFARLLCDNVGATVVPRKAFLFGGLTKCSNIPKVLE